LSRSKSCFGSGGDGNDPLDLPIGEIPSVCNTRPSDLFPESARIERDGDEGMGTRLIRRDAIQLGPLGSNRP